MTELEWDKLLSSTRRKSLAKGPSASSAAGARTEIERDYDRILFSTPVRRLADKTQVFPLEKNDSVRTRLTHSHEVSNLARSIGVALCYEKKLFPSLEGANRNIPSLLAAVGLAHDIGNPPFGHQGESAISSWFDEHKADVFGADAAITPQMRQDYLRFEGNAQAFRILTRLQIINDKFGLNLTCASLAALMKYPVSSDKTDDKIKVKKKFGYFYSETDVVKEVWSQTGLSEGLRHPLAYVMEASDDIAYSVLDVEDSVKKNLVSYRDLIGYLEHHGDKDPVVQSVMDKSEADYKEHKQQALCPSELNDISMQKFRVWAIAALVENVTDAFVSNQTAILNGGFRENLIGASEAKKLCKLLKDFAFQHAYKHKSVLELELKGHKTIHSLMDMLWPAIVTRGNPLEKDQHDGNPFEQYVYSRISENYKRVFEDKANHLPLHYKRAQLLADMISGMTDNFAIDLDKKLKSLKLDN